MPFIFVGF